MNRRGFFGRLLGGAVAAVVAPAVLKPATARAATPRIVRRGDGAMFAQYRVKGIVAVGEFAVVDVADDGTCVVRSAMRPADFGAPICVVRAVKDGRALVQLSGEVAWHPSMERVLRQSGFVQ